MTPRSAAPATGPSTPKGEASREHILQTAAGVFAAKGYPAATFQDLIAASGMTKGAFYFYFQSKETLALAVLERKQRAWLRTVSSALEQAGDRKAALASLAEIMLRLHRDDPSAWSISRLTKDLAQLPSVAEQARQPMREWVDLVADLIRAAQASGQARADVDPQTLAGVLVAGFDGIKALHDVLGAGGQQARFEDGVRTFARLTEEFLFG
jgi:AcrR family transcriptional regulator